MISIDLISKIWPGKRDTSNNYDLDREPSGSIEALVFGRDPRSLVQSGSEGRETLFNINYYQDIREKGKYAKFTYQIAELWIIILLVVVLLQGFGGRGSVALEILSYRKWYLNFHLSENEFIAFMTSTTATILGLSYLVGRYLFRQPNSKKTKQNDNGLLDQLRHSAQLGDLSPQTASPSSSAADNQALPPAFTADSRTTNTTNETDSDGDNTETEERSPK